MSDFSADKFIEARFGSDVHRTDVSDHATYSSVSLGRGLKLALSAGLAFWFIVGLIAWYH